MKVRCRFVLLHDQDNDPLLINVDKISRVTVNTDEYASASKILFNDSEHSQVRIVESVTKTLNLLNNVQEIEVDEYLLLHDSNNEYSAVRVCEIMDIFMLQKNDNGNKAKIYFDNSEFLHIKENVNKIYSLLSCVQEKTKS